MTQLVTVLSGQCVQMLQKGFVAPVKGSCTGSYAELWSREEEKQGKSYYVNKNQDIQQTFNLANLFGQFHIHCPMFSKSFASFEWFIKTFELFLTYISASLWFKEICGRNFTLSYINFHILFHIYFVFYLDFYLT